MDIQEQTASEIKRTALDMGKTGAGAARKIVEGTVGTTAAAVKLSLHLISFLRAKNSTAEIDGGEITLDKMQSRIEKGDFMTSVTVADEDIEFYKSAMQKEKMAYVVLDVNNDDCKNIIYLNSDTEKLKNVIALHHARAGITNEVEPDLFLRHIEDKNIGAVRNLTDTEFELFRETAREKDLTFSFYRKDDRVTVLYNLKDTSMLNDILNVVSWDLTGKYASTIADKLSIQQFMRRELTNAIKERGDFYAVNAKNSGNYLTLTQEGLAYYKNDNKVVEIPRTDKNFASKAREKFKALQNPVVLSKTEFKTPIEERELIMQNRYNIYSAYTAEAIKKSHEHLNNVISKMSLDDENENPAQVFDDSISYSNYAEYEKLSDTDREELEQHIKNFSEHRCNIDVKEIPVKDRVLDNIIREAERSKTNSNSKDERHNDIQHEYENEDLEI